jgi:hypothetical protein
MRRPISNLTALDEFFSADLIDHDPPPIPGLGPRGRRPDPDREARDAPTGEKPDSGARRRHETVLTERQLSAATAPLPGP